MDEDSKSDYHVQMVTNGTRKYVVGRIAPLVLMLSALSASLFGLDVAEEELRRIEGADIQFVNFEGFVESPQSLAAIVGIGEYLAEHGSYFGRYRIVRAIDESVPSGLDADILFILPDARVNHINNVRAIIAGYLETQYGYPSTTALLLARLTTIYNAVHRGDLPFFEERYKPVVLQNLSAEYVGISVLYSEWPGTTELVLPLRSARARIDPFALADERVIDDLRARQDMGLEDRRDLVGLMDDIILQEAEEIAEEQERIAGELRDLEERERELLEREERLQTEREAFEEAPEDERAAREETITEQEQQIAEDRDALETQREAVESEQERVAERDAELEDLEAQAQDVRDGIAEDQQQLMEDEEVTIATVPADPEVVDTRTIIALQVHAESGGRPQSRLVRIDAESGNVLEAGPVDRILSRSLVQFGPENEFAVLREDAGGVSRLALVSPSDLTEVSVASEELYPGTALVFVNDHVYAVSRIDGSYRLARFNQALERTAHSQQAVLPAALPIADGNRMIVQMSDNRFAVLDAETLETSGAENE